MERGCSAVCLFIFTTIHLLAVHADNKEVTALVAMKDALSDPNDALQNWDPSLVSPCTYFHVTCDNSKTPKVLRIDLGRYNLNGPLVPDLQDLTELQYLELYNNQINGPIPKEFGNLSNLVSLDLYGNNLNGSIPEELANLKSLKFLRLNDNKFQGPLPKAIIQNLIPQLKDFNISNNPAMCGPYTENPLCL